MLTLIKGNVLVLKENNMLVAAAERNFSLDKGYFGSVAYDEVRSGWAAALEVHPTPSGEGGGLTLKGGEIRYGG